MATLIVLGPPAAGQRYGVRSNGTTVIGRDTTCDVVLRKSTVSRHHAQIVVHQGRFFIEDSASANGTFVNGRRIHERTALYDGDRINIHDATLAFFVSDHIDIDEESTLQLPRGEAVGAAETDHEIPLVGDTALKDRLNALAEITRYLGSTLHAEDILPRVLDLIFRMFPQATVGEIFFRDEEGSPSPVAMKHGPDSDSADLTRPPHNLELVQDVLQSGQSVIRRRDSGGEPSVLDDVSDSTICVPIPGQQDVVAGAILLISSDPAHEFQEDDLELIGIVGVLAGQAIGYSRAHKVVMEHEQTERQLETARTVQLSMLPHQAPSVPGYAFQDYYVASERVGGDYFFYDVLPDGRAVLGIADASGKGLPAAMHIVRFAGEVRFRLATSATLQQAMGHLSTFAGRFGDWTFITCCICVIDPDSHSVTIVNAGHMAPLCRRQKSGTVEMLESVRGGLPLGIDNSIAYHPVRHTLEPGDQVLLYTDGVSEAMNAAGELYGRERLIDLMMSQRRSLGELIDAIVADLIGFRAGRAVSDDVCMVGFERLALSLGESN